MIPTAHQDLNFGVQAAQPPAADVEPSPRGPYSPADPTEHNQIVHSALQCVCLPPPVPSPCLVLLSNLFPARREETQLLPWLCSGHRHISIIDLRSPCSAWSVPLLLEPQKDLDVQPGQGEKDPVCQTLVVCSMHGKAAGAHHTALGSSPPSQQPQELLSQPSQAPCMTGQEHRHQLREVAAEPLAGLGPHWLQGAQLSSAGTH